MEPTFTLGNVVTLMAAVITPVTTAGLLYTALSNKIEKLIARQETLESDVRGLRDWRHEVSPMIRMHDADIADLKEKAR